MEFGMEEKEMVKRIEQAVKPLELVRNLMFVLSLSSVLGLLAVHGIGMESYLAGVFGVNEVMLSVMFAGLCIGLLASGVYCYLAYESLVLDAVIAGDSSVGRLSFLSKLHSVMCLLVGVVIGVLDFLVEANSANEIVLPGMLGKGISLGLVVLLVFAIIYDRKLALRGRKHYC